MIRCGYEVGLSSDKRSRYVATITSVSGSVTVLVENDDAELLLKDVEDIRIDVLSAMTLPYDKVVVVIRDDLDASAGSYICYAYILDEPPFCKAIAGDTVKSLFDAIENLLDGEHINLP
jgi:hypothetical protein